MTHPQSKVDKWFMRVKDALIILPAAGALFLFLFRYHALPDEVAANAAEIKAQKTQIQELHDSFLTMNAKQDYTIKSMDEMKGWMKALSQRSTRTTVISD